MKRPRLIWINLVIIFIFIFSFSNTNVKACIVENASSQRSGKNYNILVDLTELRMYLIDKNSNKVVKTYPVAGGKSSTPSPIGTWTIVDKASGWGKGFGTRWMGLNVPWGKYGIHGTNKPLSIGGAESLGCIRMHNNDVEDLYKRVECGTSVVIYGGPYGMFSNNFRTLTPGDRGADVFEVQRRMKNIGYYPGTLDGIYGDSMKHYVVKFRKEKNLSITHTLDREFYKKLDITSFE